MEPARDATVVGKLRDAGAVILGKLALDEYGIGAPDPATGFRIPALVARYLVGAGVVAVAISATLVPIPAAGGLALLTAIGFGASWLAKLAWVAFVARAIGVVGASAVIIVAMLAVPEV